MKKINIVYNPFLLRTVITVDGKKPGSNSSLDFQKQRLQEWAEKLPKILVDEYRDKNISIEFTGTLDDFIDLKEILKVKKDVLDVKDFIHHRTLDVAEVEKKVDQIYKDILKGPVESLKDKKIQKAFDEALRAEFTINVVATMSSGKSSLINAILGVNLMPVANMATTATIVSIYASDKKHTNGFSGIAYDKNNKELMREKDLNIDVMREWNSNPSVSSIDIYGPIPCVDKVGMRLILVDTPGPNNSRDENHKALTYDMLAQSEKSLVLFVMNAEALQITDEKEFLDYVCDCMKKGGKQSRDRFIFTVNKLDSFKPKHTDNVVKALTMVKKGLDDLDIKEPNIFPVTALSALELRTKDEDSDTLFAFGRKCEKYGENFHFEKYYNFNHLPIPSRVRISELAKSENQNAELEVHTGVPSIEEAIRLYVNKYARTMKVKDLVDSFNKRLKELRTEVEIQKRIHENQAEKEKLDKEITKIEREIKSGNSAKEYISLIDNIDVIGEVEEELGVLIGGLQDRIELIIDEYDNDTKMLKNEAVRVVSKLEKSRIDLQAQLDSRIEKIFDKTFKKTYDQIISVYRERLQQLGFKSSDGDFEFNPIDFVGSEIPQLDKIITDSTETRDEGENVTTYETKIRKVRRKNFLARFLFGEYKEEEYKKPITTWVANYVDYVDMSKVVNEYFVPLQIELNELQKKVPLHIMNESKELKGKLKIQFAEIEKLLQAKLKNIKEMFNNVSQAEAKIKKQKEQLEWMKGVIDQVNKLIYF